MFTTMQIYALAYYRQIYQTARLKEERSSVLMPLFSMKQRRINIAIQARYNDHTSFMWMDHKIMLIVPSSSFWI